LLKQHAWHSVHRPATAPTLCFYQSLVFCRNIDKAGGLDNYILSTKDKYLDSDVAIDLKINMLEKLLRQQDLKDVAQQGIPAAARVLQSDTVPDN